ncbi:3-keto-5-aminohexanoate cleavage protein [Thalassospira sp. MCCC 1A01428]|uniref:3-keto-5-aminohexanoate cleavage protein n=1 Tax=Thalassospira sp. MCCC 1A01428 TaxID=1470575 RepID=UPI000A1E55E4|nr:3-keto-5-aminohexanoate cleavage protein [Thalassospira sp. MCCC 1A01428]OSQ42198.1 3-keto-5-aminohexanoate cleavage protein [Thalassospira sp. MCCC 1A01428]
MADKVIITCAITGSVHTPSMSPHLPITPDEIADQAIAAADAGAAILHLHARDPKTGFPAPNPDLFMQFLPRIKDATNAVINISTGGGMTMTVEQRIQAAQQAAPEMASLNLGTMNFGLFPALNRKTEWLHNWEPEFLENSRDFVFKNTFSDIEIMLAKLGEANGTRFEFECYDVGHLYTLAHYVDRGLVKGPIFLQFVLGILGGIGADPENLIHMKATADRLFGDQYRFSVLGAGRHQIPFATMSASMGGHVRVGLEDNLYIRKGQLAQNNAEQVVKIREILAGLNLEIATPDEARVMLGLKGADNVSF